MAVQEVGLSLMQMLHACVEFRNQAAGATKLAAFNTKHAGEAGADSQVAHYLGRAAKFRQQATDLHRLADRWQHAATRQLGFGGG